MTTLTRNRIAPILLVALLAIGITALPAIAFADDSSSTTSSTSSTSTSLPDFVPAVTVLPLLGSNITIELSTDADGIVSMVTIDGELADHELEVEDGEIEIEFLLTNADGTFEVEVEFEDDGIEIEVETDGPAPPGDHVWSGESCDGTPFSIAYTIDDDGSLTLGAITGDVARARADSEEIEVRLADGTEVEFEAEGDGFEINQKCHDDSSTEGDDDFDDEFEDDSDEEFEDDDSEDDDHDSEDD